MSVRGLLSAFTVPCEFIDGPIVVATRRSISRSSDTCSDEPTAFALGTSLKFQSKPFGQFGGRCLDYNTWVWLCLVMGRRRTEPIVSSKIGIFRDCRQTRLVVDITLRRSQALTDV